jgi:hypothetical protein
MTDEHMRELLAMAHDDGLGRQEREACEFAFVALESQPRWMDRPSGPGLWAMECETKNTNQKWAGMWLDQSDIDRGAPFGVVRVFGPIQIPKERA